MEQIIDIKEILKIFEDKLIEKVKNILYNWWNVRNCLQVGNDKDKLIK